MGRVETPKESGRVICSTASFPRAKRGVSQGSENPTVLRRADSAASRFDLAFVSSNPRSWSTWRHSFGPSTIDSPPWRIRSLSSRPVFAFLLSSSLCGSFRYHQTIVWLKLIHVDNFWSDRVLTWFEPEKLLDLLVAWFLHSIVCICSFQRKTPIPLNVP